MWRLKIFRKNWENMMLSEEAEEKKSVTTVELPDINFVSDASKKIVVPSQGKLENSILNTITDPVTFMIFRRPVILTGTNEVVELATAKKLMATTKRGLDNRPITGYTEIFTLNSLIESYMEKNPMAERYPEYPKTVDERKPRSTSSSLVNPVLSQGLFSEHVSARIRGNLYSVYLPQILIVKPNNLKNEMKVLLIGNHDSGKTHLLQAGNYHVRSSFIDLRIIKQNNIKFCFWNTAAQERFRTITSSYYRNVDAIILMSSEGIRNYLVDAQKYISSDFRYYGIQYSQGGQSLDFIPVVNQDNPDDFPAINNFTDRIIGMPCRVDWSEGCLADLLDSLLDNITAFSNRPISGRSDLPENNSVQESRGRSGCFIS